MKTENITVGLNTEYPLKGLLTLPDDFSSPVPAVVLVHGSGPSNMDEKVMKLTPFRDLAEGLAERGIASIRYDKRTFVHARKMLKVSVTVREETIEDAILAADMLRNDPRIDPQRIYIVGHSMGAMLAPRIDAEGGNFAGIIMMAGTNFRLEDIVIRQLRQGAASGGFIMKKLIGLESRIYEKKFRGLYEMSDEEARKKSFAPGMSLYYFKEMGQKTAVDYLRENDKPVFIMQGGRDFQVLPEEDYADLKKQLETRENVTFRLYPSLNHVFVEAIYDDILKASKDYSVERHIPEEVINDIAQFINERN